MSRPRKNKLPPDDSRAPYDGGEQPSEAQLAETFAWFESVTGVKLPLDAPEMTPDEVKSLALSRQQRHLDQLRVDPFRDDPASIIYAPIILGRASKNQKKDAGNCFVSLLEKASVSQLESVFARLLKLKKNAELPHRNSTAYLGYARFMEETGREPKKPELKRYLLARPETYKGLPPGDDKKAWSRLLEECGLKPLLDR